MVLQVDTSEPLLRPSQLTAVVAAVRDAEDHDEHLWIEWKSGLDNDGQTRTPLDLTSAAGLAQIAKAVLGLANRDPGAAAQRVGGYGYLLVGVEPGAINGVTPVDLQVLVTKVRAFIGDVVRWYPEYVHVDGVQVLVVIVDPPRPGDRIHCLRKPVHRYEPGTVFVRRPGLTDRATPADLDRLQSRLLERMPSLQMTVAAAPATIERTPNIPAAVEQWVEQRRSALLAARYEAPQQRTPPFADLSSIISGFDPFGPKAVPDKRTEDEYAQEVEEFLDYARQALPGRAVWELYRYAPAMLHVEVTNPTDIGYLRVRLVVYVPGEVKRFPDELEDLAQRDRPSFRSPPEPLGTPTVTNDRSVIEQMVTRLGGLPGIPLADVDLGLATGPGFRVRDTGSVEVEYDEFELRPGDTISLDPVPLLVREDPGVALTAMWHATAEGVRGRLSGECTLTVAESSLDLGNLDHDEPADE